MSLSPARAHLRRMQAEREAAQAADTMAGSSLYEQMLAQLHTHLRQLKQVQSRQRRTELKSEYLPDYAEYVEGVLAEGHGAADEVVMQVLVWRLDVQDMVGFMAIADYALEHHLSLPARFGRSLACFVVEETSEYVLAQDEDEQAAAGLALLRQVAPLTEGADMPDEVRAKQHKAFAVCLAQQTEGVTEAISHYEQALALHPTIKQVKQPLARLKKQQT